MAECWGGNVTTARAQTKAVIDRWRLRVDDRTQGLDYRPFAGAGSVVRTAALVNLVRMPMLPVVNPFPPPVSPGFPDEGLWVTFVAQLSQCPWFGLD